MRLIVTGASGFIGQQIVPLLKEQNVEMLLIGRDTAKLTRIFPDEKTASYEQIADEGRGFDALLHLAALNNDQPGDDNDFHAANVSLIEEVIEASRAADIPRLIYTRSLQAGAANTPYGRSKATADQVLTDMDDITLIMFRLPAVHGKGAYNEKLGFQTLASLKPTAHVRRIADATIEHGKSNSPVNDIISDCQEGNRVYVATKKLIDLSFALAILVFFWWLLIGVWVVVKLTSKGSRHAGAGAGRALRQSLHAIQIPHHGTRHEASRHARSLKCVCHQRRPLPAQVKNRRTAASHQHPEGRDQPRRTDALFACSRRADRGTPQARCPENPAGRYWLCASARCGYERRETFS